MQDVVTCPVCLGLFDEPIDLLCGHSLCLNCFQGVAAVQRMLARGVDPGSTASRSTCTATSTGTENDGRSQLVECVFKCGVKTPLTDSVTKNTTIKNVVERVKREMTLKSLCSLGYCESEETLASPATIVCREPPCAGAVFCESCFRKHHLAPRLKSHKGENIPPSGVVQKHVCQKHPKEELKWYCAVDDCPVCSLCERTSHREHSCVPLEDFLESEKAHLLSLVQDFETQIKMETEAAESISRSREQLAFTTAERIQSLELGFRSLCDAAISRLKTLTTQVRDHEAALDNGLQLQRDSINMLINTHTSLQSKLSSALQSMDLVNLIQIRSASKRLLEISRTTLPLEPCIDIQNLPTPGNFDALIVAINEIGTPSRTVVTPSNAYIIPRWNRLYTGDAGRLHFDFSGDGLTVTKQRDCAFIQTAVSMEPLQPAPGTRTIKFSVAVDPAGGELDVGLIADSNTLNANGWIRKYRPGWYISEGKVGIGKKYIVVQVNLATMEGTFSVADKTIQVEHEGTFDPKRGLHAAVALRNVGATATFIPLSE
ncbi:hypothetical protein Pelo_2653 [Pelomyxa schiedti]|nr:hypothetical protein Pelo_2653 [Pelomyxa schiedti]